MAARREPAWRRDVFAQAWSGLLRLHAALVPLVDADLSASTGMPLSWYDVLLELYVAADQRMTMSELGEVAVLSRSRVSRVVDELQRAGYVDRSTNPDDRRSSFAVLTEDGRAAFRRAAPAYLRIVRARIGSVLDADDAQTLGDISERALARVKDSAAERKPPPPRM